MSDHPVFKLGRKEPTPDKPRLQLSKYFSDFGSPQAMPPFFDIDRSLGASFIPYTWGNTEYGDCVIAARANAAQRLEFAERGFHVNIHEQDAIAEYKKLTGCQSPGDANDTGLVIQDALNEWRVNGWAVHYSHKPETIAAFGEVQLAEIRQAIWELGGVQLGFDLPISAQAQTGNGFWDVITPDPGDGSTDPGSWGGHCVFGRGYDQSGIVVKSWGMNIHVSDAFLAKYCSEVWGVVDSVETKHSRFDEQALLADLKQITGFMTAIIGPPGPVCDVEGHTSMIPGFDDDGKPIWACAAGCYYPRTVQAAPGDPASLDERGVVTDAAPGSGLTESEENWTCPNGPDETGNWPCDPISDGEGVATCSVCGFVGAINELADATQEKA